MSQNTDATDSVSAYVDSARVVEERPPGPHIKVVSWPAQECPDVPDGAEAALDVYVRRSRNESEFWPVHEERGAFASTSTVVSRALELADELAIPVLDETQRIE